MAFPLPAVLSVLSLFPNAVGVGVDLSAEAIEVAKRNAVKLQMSCRATFLVSNWTEQVQGSFDLITSNPPYISLEEFEKLDETVKRLLAFSWLLHFPQLSPH